MKVVPETVRFAIKKNKIFLFNKETEERIYTVTEKGAKQKEVK